MILNNGHVRVTLQRYSHIPDVDLQLSIGTENGSATVTLNPHEARLIAQALTDKAAEWELLDGVPNPDDRDAVAAVLARKQWREAQQ